MGGYDGAWGAFKDITFPVAGNHEWKTPGAQGYLDYFAGSSYWYTFARGPWRFYALDGTCESNGGCAPAIPSTSGCRINLLPIPSSASSPTGTNPGSLLACATAPMGYWSRSGSSSIPRVRSRSERSRAQLRAVRTAGCVRKPHRRRITEIIAGTGGNGEGSYPFGDPIPNSLVRLNGLGLVELRLWDGGWLERFHGLNSEVLDRTSGTC